jgi:truncated hemoglobin YjbI
VGRTIYEAMGGAEAVLALAGSWHERCLTDQVLAHAFRGGVHPQHTERLAAYWAEQLGGPTDYSDSMSDYSHVVRVHTGNGPHEQMDGRAVAA